ncbi:MAG: sensor histidine kinase [Pseudomonadota bacterium]
MKVNEMLRDQNSLGLVWIAKPIATLAAGVIPVYWAATPTAAQTVGASTSAVEPQSLVHTFVACLFALLVVLAGVIAVLRYKQQRLKKAKGSLTEQISALEQSLMGVQNTNTLLLNEIDHRLKNNLQTIISLTNFEIRRVDRREQDARKALKDLMGRLEAIATIQKSLSFRSHTQSISAQTLLESILSFTAQRCQSIKKTNAETNALRIDPIVATPLGLAFHEICCFAAESCSKRQNCGVDVSFTEEGESHILTVRAIGIGSEASRIDFSNELGSEIIKMLATQINAKVEAQADENESYWRFSYLYSEADNQTRHPEGVDASENSGSLVT